MLEEMRENIEKHLPRFWDAGIRGPDFIWAATGPALEAYSKYPAVKKADQPDSLMTVSEFLGHVRRMVVDYVVGRILSANGEAAEALDDLTIYYLLHRQSFGMEEAPVGAVILYAQSCNLRDRDLIDRFDILAHGKSKAEAEEDEETEDEEDAGEETGTSGSTVKLKRWDSRKHKDLGYRCPRAAKHRLLTGYTASCSYGALGMCRRWTTILKRQDSAAARYSPNYYSHLSSLPARMSKRMKWLCWKAL